MRWLLAALAGAILTACATPTPVPPAPAFYVMRHLNTPAGERDPDLLPEGRRLAEVLSERLRRQPPATIFVSTFKRTRQTAEPLAARLGLTPIVYDPADTPGLVARVRAAPGPVLVVGHSNTVPEIVQRLGGERPADLTHPDFGDLWVIQASGATARERLGD